MKLEAEELLGFLSELESISDTANGPGTLQTCVVTTEIADHDLGRVIVTATWEKRNIGGGWLITSIEKKEDT